MLSMPVGQSRALQEGMGGRHVATLGFYQEKDAKVGNGNKSIAL